MIRRKLLLAAVLVVAACGAVRPIVVRAQPTTAGSVLAPSDPAFILANGEAVCWGVDRTIASIVINTSNVWTGTIAPRVRYGTSSTNYTPPSGAADQASLNANGQVTITNLGFTRICMVATAAMTGRVDFVAIAGGSNLGGGGSFATMESYLDGVETLLTTIDGRVDGLEALLTTQAGYLDNLETLIGGTNTYLAAIDASLPAVAALADNTANPSLSAIAAYMMCFDGTTWDRCAFASDMTIGTAFGTAGPGVVGSYKDFDGSALPITLNVGTEEEAVPWALSQYGVAYNMLVNEDGSLAALLGHDAVDTGLLFGVGYRAIAHGTNPTAVAAGDRTVGYASRAGVPFVIGGHPNVQTLEAQVEDADGPQTNAALVTVNAGTKIVVTRAAMKCDAANSGAINGLLGFGAASIPARAHTGVAGIVAAFDGIPAGGGSVEGGGSGILGVGADGEDLRLTMEDPAGGACSVAVSYYTVES